MKKEILVLFGKRIRELRIQHDWSQEDLAEQTGFHRTYIGMIERAERNLSLVNIKVFAESFKITISELFQF
jgi:transcriptional regulator with XRE-family HTH domain